MPSATLNNSGPGSAIGQARKSHPPASFKIKGQGGIKEKANTSLKQRLHSAVPVSQLPTMFCQEESAEPGRCRGAKAPHYLHPCLQLTTANTSVFLTPLLQSNSMRKPTLKQVVSPP